MGCYIIADNQELTRYALDTLVGQGEHNVVCRASNRVELMELLRKHGKAVVVLDYTQFDFTDEAQLLIVSERFAEATWLLISEDLTEGFLRRVLYSSHAFSVVFKDGTLDEVREALRESALGHRYICQRAMEHLLKHRREDEVPDVLTATEMEIVRCIARGLTTKEIAAERFSSFHTITTHRKNIFRKLKVNTAHEVIKYALRAGWVDSSEFYI